MIKNHSTAALRQTASRQHSTQSLMTSPSPVENVKNKKSKSLIRAQSVKDVRVPPIYSCELSIDDRAPGVIKIFGDSVVQGVQYKSVLASTRSTAVELIKQALERYGLSTYNYHDYVLCDTVGKLEPVPSDPDQPGWVVVCQRALKDSDKPLEFQDFWKPTDGFYRRYELHKKSDFLNDNIADDTSGINSNARKIMMSKVHVGAIPLSSSWSGSDNSQETVRQDPDGKSLQPPMFDTSSYKEKILTLQSLAMYPYLLTIRGYHVHHDLVLYPLRAKSLTLGRHHSTSTSADIVCFAPDILDNHCRLNPRSYIDKGINQELKYMFYIELDVTPGAHVTINGRRVVGNTELHSGDIISLGKHYLFLYKDPTNGYDIPSKLPWLSARRDTVGKRSSLPVEFRTHGGRLTTAASEELNTSSDIHTSFDVSDEGVTWTGPPKDQPMTLTYSKDREEEALTAIAGLKCLSRRDHPLTAAMLFILCHDCAVRKFTRHHIRNMYRRMLACIQNSISSVARNLSQQKFDSIKFGVNVTSHDFDAGNLKHLMYWMSNAISLYCHMVSLESDSGSPEPEDESNSGIKEFLEGLEEIISFCFQQTVYCITKVLYPLTSRFLEANPFSEHIPQETDGVGKTIFTLHVANDLAKGVQLHDDVRTQMMTYLLFFVGTTIFNRLLRKDSGPEYYNWNFGVRLQANLSRLEDWVAGKNLNSEFHQVCDKLLSLSNLLATSRQTLIKMDWNTISDEFSALNSNQLITVLQGYQVGKGRQAPDHWFPREEFDQSTVLSISLASYPVFLLPTTGVDVTAMSFPDNFYETIDRLQSAFGLEEDDSDSGFSVSNTPRLSETMVDNTVTNGNIFYNTQSPRQHPRLLLDNTNSYSIPNSPRTGHVYCPSSREELSSASDYWDCETDLADDNTVIWRGCKVENKLDEKVCDTDLRHSCSIIQDGVENNTSVYTEPVSVNDGNDLETRCQLASPNELSHGGELTNRIIVTPSEEMLMSDENEEIFTVNMEKGCTQLGLGLIDGLYTPLKSPGIYIRYIMSDSAAERCGVLRVGDRIMVVNETSVVAASYQIAMEYIRSTGRELRMVIARSPHHIIEQIQASMQ